VATDVKVPRLAESISEAVLAQWLKQDGEPVRADEPIAILETDKAAVEIPADRDGVLRHARRVGDQVTVGQVIARIEEGAPAPPERKPAARGTAPAAEPAAPARRAAPPGEPAVPSRPPTPHGAETLGPAARRMIEELGLDPAKIEPSGRGGRILKEDVQRHLEAQVTKEDRLAVPVRPRAAVPAPDHPGDADPTAAVSPRPAPPASDPARAPSPPRPIPGPPPAVSSPAAVAWAEGEEERAVPMSRIRQRIAERLVRAQQTAAILTTFNEVDMSAVVELRSRFRESFERRHGVKLSYMSFFTRACTLALQQIPEINAEIRGADIVYKRHVHMGIAVQTERGLVVPVVHGADRRSFADLEKEIARLAQAARENHLTLSELSGGTFTISNGGVFGSLLSTPILNPPQSGIIGMHKIEKRPVVVDDQVVIRPMMYLALSYDHRIVDGEQAVTFLVSVKLRLEDPEQMLVDL
jgi:2-oxoglutarate dehydrogenase E2 component (dihydrolipoamide succinyltransferase)